MDNNSNSIYQPGVTPYCPVCMEDLVADPTGELSGTGLPCYYCPKDLYTIVWDFEAGKPVGF